MGSENSLIVKSTKYEKVITIINIDVGYLSEMKLNYKFSNKIWFIFKYQTIMLTMFMN